MQKSKDIFEIDYYQILEDVYNEHNQVIVAFDFDNTVYDYHKKGLDCSKIIDLLIECDKLGFPLICLTSNTGGRLTFIKHYLDEVLGIKGINFLGVNAQYVPEGKAPFVVKLGESFTKPYYNIFLDDKAGLGEAYGRLSKLVNKVLKTEIV